MVDISETVVIDRAALRAVARNRKPMAAGLPANSAFASITAVALLQWRALAERVIEPNGYYLPGWELAVNAFAAGRTGVSALIAWGTATQHGVPGLIGMMPVIPMARAYNIPLPALASAHPYGTLCTPPLDRDVAHDAVALLIQAARNAGARALILRDIPLDGPAVQVFNDVSRQQDLRPRILHHHFRACLDATRDAEELLREALGAKKLKELRRQRHRLADHGAIRFEVARSRDEVTAALEVFLKLEASGWKARRGTALIQDEGDARFIRRAASALAESGQCEIVSLRAGEIPIAAAIVLRHQDRAFYFKLGVDERFAKFSPGVQLTLDLTRHLCADPAIMTADSTAGPDHPMINPIWRGRFAIGDILLPLRKNDPVVPLIYAALLVRGWGRNAMRFAVHAIRRRQT